ncbi:set-3, partial [Parelaphostrongylus tenuis]
DISMLLQQDLSLKRQHYLLQADPNPVDISSTHDLVTDIVNRLDSECEKQCAIRRRSLSSGNELRSILATNCNYLLSFHGNKLIFISMGIRKGEEVCDNYGVSYFKHTREERRTFLADRGFTCDCSVCVEGDSIDDMLEIITDRPDVRTLNSKLFKIVRSQIISFLVFLQSLPNVEHYKLYRNTLPDGHKSIETIAEMYVGSKGGKW